MMGLFIILFFGLNRIETLFLHGGDVLQMRFHNGNGFIEKAFEVRVLRCGSFGFECLGVLLMGFDHAVDIASSNPGPVRAAICPPSPDVLHQAVGQGHALFRGQRLQVRH